MDVEDTLPDVRAQVLSLVAGRRDWPASEWAQCVDGFRRQFFGPDYKSMPFPLKLHKIVSCENLQPDIFWMDDGKSFAIHRYGYQQHIMGIFFDQSVLKSFQNRIHLYGFKTDLTTSQYDGRNAGDFIVFSHPKFERGREDLCSMIKRNDRKCKSPSTDAQKDSLIPADAAGKCRPPGNSATEFTATKGEENGKGDDDNSSVNFSKIFDEIDTLKPSSPEDSGTITTTTTTTTTTSDGSEILPLDGWDAAEAAAHVELTQPEAQKLLDDLGVDFKVSQTNNSSDTADCCSMTSITSHFGGSGAAFI